MTELIEGNVQFRFQHSDPHGEPLGLTQAEMEVMVQRDAEIYSRIVKAKNIKVD